MMPLSDLEAMGQIIERVGAKVRAQDTLLKDETEARHRAERLINTHLCVSMSLCQSLTMDDLCKNALNCIANPENLFNSGGIYIRDNGTYSLRASVGLSQDFLDSCSKMDSSSLQVKNFVESGHPYFGSYPPIGIDKKDIADARLKEGLATFCLLPLKSSGEVVGCINLASKERFDVDECSQETLINIASHLGEAVSRMRVFDDLKEQKVQLEIISSSARDCIVILNKEKIVRANRAFAEKTGWTEEDLVGRELCDIVYRFDTAVLDDAIKGELDHCSLRFNRRNADPVRLDVNVHNLKKINGYEECLVLVARAQ
jgi:PAS domain S-box-containing protein